MDLMMLGLWSTLVLLFGFGLGVLWEATSSRMIQRRMKE